MSQSVFGAAAAVTMLNRAFNNSSPANAVFNNQVAEAGSTAEGQFAFATTFAASFNTLTDAQLAERVLGNLGVLPNDPLLAAVADYFTATGVQSRGIVVLQLGQILAGLENATGEQAIYAPQALAWNREVEKSFLYSSNTANTTSFTGDFPVDPVTNPGQTFTLTTGVDTIAGTSGDDTVNASNTATSLVLGGLDSVDGGAGNDTLNVADTNTAAAAQFALPAGFTVKNVEALNVTTNGGVNMDVSTTAGLTGIKTVAAGTANTAITAAATTDVTATVAGAATTTVTGGKAVSVTGGTGTTTVTGKGLTSVAVKGGGAVTIDNLENSVAATTAKGTTLTSVTLDSVDAASAIKGEGLTDVTIKGATTGAQTVTITNAKVDHALTVNVDGTGYKTDGTAVQTVLVDAAAKTITVNATGTKSSLALTGSTAATTVNITGSAALTLAPLASATKVDGSAATGALTLGDLNAGTISVSTGAGNDSFALQATNKVTVDAGAGNDSVTLKSAIAAGSTVNLGAGDDKLLVSGGSVAASTVTAVTVIDAGDGNDTVGAALINAANAAQFKNFESLDLSATANLDVELMTGSTITGLTLTGSTGAQTAVVSNVAVGAGLTISGDNSSMVSTTINVKGAAASTTDTFAITFAGAAAAAAPVAANVLGDVVVLNNVETVSIASAGGANTWNSITLTDDKLKVVTITGDKNLDLTFAGVNGTNPVAAAGGAVNSIDGSAATGKLNINTTNVTADDKAGVGLTVKGGSAADTITLAQKATVDAGAGADTIVVAAAGGTLTGGAGNDTFDVTLAIATGTTEATSVLTTITDLAVGDKIDFAATSSGAFNQTKVTLGAGVTNLDLALAAAVGGANTTQWFQYGANTYIVSNDADAAFDAGDTVIKVTGLVDLSTSTMAATVLTIA